MKNVTLRQLRVFASVGRHLSFARAAEELALTPPAVSMQIKDLEEQVGAQLFERSGRKVSLTTLGEYLLAHARKILAALRDADDMVSNLKGLRTGVLDVAMVSTASGFVPGLLAQFKNEHPNVVVKLQVAENREQIADLMRGSEVELAIMGRPPTEWATRAEPFALNPLVLVTAPGHPWVYQTRVEAVSLASETLILREPASGTRAALDDFLRANNVVATGAMQMSSNEAIKQAVMAGMGLALISLHTIGLELKHGLLALASVNGLPILRRWHIVHSAGRVLSPVAEAFRYFVLEEGERFLARKFGDVPFQVQDAAIRPDNHQGAGAA